MKILVTGGAGFIGSHTVDALVEKGHKVRILDNLQPTVHPKGKPDYLHPEAEFLLGDVRDKATWENALAGMDAIYHLAAYQDYMTDFSTFFHANAVSTALLYEVLINSGMHKQVQKIIVAASQAVMGEGRYKCSKCHGEKSEYLYPDIRLEAQLATGRWEHTCPVCNETLQWLPSDEPVVNPCNPYAISKYGQEKIALQLGRRYEIPTAVLRYSIVQGPRQSFFNAYSGAMRIFALSLYTNRAPIIFEDGQQVRDYINIRDAVAANLLALEDPRADYRVFNVGGGHPWTVVAFYETMQEIVGKRLAPIVSSYYRYGDTRHIFSDIGCLTSLGWAPRYGVPDSIRDYWNFLQNRSDTGDILEYAEKQMKKNQVIRRVNPD